MKQSVYIESTIISYLTAKPSRDLIVAAHQQITREWWESVLPRLEPFVSQFVINEISVGDPAASATRLSASSTFPLLEMTPDVADLAARYFKAIQIPEKARSDAFHLAIATWHGLDYVVSWNCTHIASGRVRTIVERINSEFDMATPTICTPEELMEV
jgi:predicted nucleic acid-binding protein